MGLSSMKEPSLGNEHGLMTFLLNHFLGLGQVEETMPPLTRGRKKNPTPAGVATTRQETRKKRPAAPSRELDLLTPQRPQKKCRTDNSLAPTTDDQKKQDGLNPSPPKSTTPVKILPSPVVAEERDVPAKQVKGRFQLPIPGALPADYKTINQDPSLHPLFNVLGGERRDWTFTKHPMNSPLLFSRENVERINIELGGIQKYSEEDLWMNYSAFNFVNMWMGADIDQKECVLLHPAVFELASKNANFRAEENLLKNHLPVDPMGPDGLLDLTQCKIIDFTIYNKQHFSRAIVINPALVLEDRFGVDKNQPAPVILFGNSLSSTKGGHSLEKVSQVIRRLLNHYVPGQNMFTERFLRSFELPIPQQTDGYTCGLHSLLFRYRLLGALRDGYTVTREDVSNGFKNFTEKFLSYHGTSTTEALQVRSNIRTLVNRCLDLQCRIQGTMPLYSVSVPISDDDSYSEEQQIKTEFAPFEHPKTRTLSTKRQATAGFSAGKNSASLKETVLSPTKHKPAKKLRLTKKNLQEARSESFQGKLNQSKEGNGKEQQDSKPSKTKHRRQVVGQFARSINQMKAQTARRIFNTQVESTLALSRMWRFERKEGPVFPRNLVFSIMIDKVIDVPHKQANDGDKIRKEPKLICICEGDIDLKSLKGTLEGIIQNIDSVTICNSGADASRCCFGEGRSSVQLPSKEHARVLGLPTPAKDTKSLTYQDGTPM